MKRDAAIVVLFAGGIEIEVGERDSARVAEREIKEGCADDGVVSELDLAAVLEHEDGRFLRRFGIGCRGIGSRSGVRSGKIFWRSNVEPARLATIEPVI